MTSLNKQLTPVHEISFDGLVRRLGLVLGVPFFRISSSDGIQVVRRSSLNSPRYPLGTIRLSGFSELSDRGSTHASAHRGLPALVTTDRKRFFKVHYLPTAFRFNLRIVDDDASRMAVTLNTLHFARRNGWLKFAVAYGQSSFDVHPTVPDSMDISEATSDQDGSKEYVFETELTLNGYASLPQLMEGMVIDNIEASTFVGDGTIEGSDLAWPSETITLKPTYTVSP